MTDDAFTLIVQVDPDPSGEALPRRFRLGARVMEVTEILDRCRARATSASKLRGSDGAT